MINIGQQVVQNGFYFNSICDNNTLTGNTAVGNNWSGMQLSDSCTLNNLTANIANNNTFFGVLIDANSNNN